MTTTTTVQSYVIVLCRHKYSRKTRWILIILLLITNTKKTTYGGIPHFNLLCIKLLYRAIT